MLTQRAIVAVLAAQAIMEEPTVNGKTVMSAVAELSPLRELTAVVPVKILALKGQVRRARAAAAGAAV